MKNEGQREIKIQAGKYAIIEYKKFLDGAKNPYLGESVIGTYATRAEATKALGDNGEVVAETEPPKTILKKKKKDTIKVKG